MFIPDLSAVSAANSLTEVEFQRVSDWPDYHGLYLGRAFPARQIRAAWPACGLGALGSGVYHLMRSESSA